MKIVKEHRNRQGELIEAAKAIYPHLSAFVGCNGGVRIWQSAHSYSLRVLVWTSRATGWNLAQRQTKVTDYLYLLPKEVATTVTRVTVMTPREYEEEYFFTKPPFCEPG